MFRSFGGAPGGKAERLALAPPPLPRPPGKFGCRCCCPCDLSCIMQPLCASVSPSPVCVVGLWLSSPPGSFHLPAADLCPREGQAGVTSSLCPLWPDSVGVGILAPRKG